MVSAKCLAILYLSMTAPTLRPISALPRSGSRGAAHGVVRWPPARARWRRAGPRACAAARGRDRGCGRRSGARRDSRATVMLARSRSSNSESWNAPASSRALMAGARSAVIQSSPAGLMSSSMRAWVIMPRSPTSTTWVEVEPPLELVDLRRQGRRVAGRAFEHLDGHRAAVGARTAGRRRSAACRACRPGCSRAGQARSSAPPDSSTRRRRAPACRSRDGAGRARSSICGWRSSSQSSASVELVLVDLSETEHAAEAGGGGHRVERLGGGELGERRDQPRHDHGDDQIAAAIAGGTEQAVEPDPAQRAEHGRDMAVRQRPFDGDGVLAGRQHDCRP